MEETPRSEVDASLRDLNSGSNRLPWTRVIFFGTSASGQRAVIIGPGVVCSRAANGCSGRGIRERTIAVKRVSKRLGVGGVGRRASGIGRPRTAEQRRREQVAAVSAAAARAASGVS